MKRVLCVWLPNWPLQRIIVEQTELRQRPVVLYQATRRGLQVLTCCRAAAGQGVFTGMPVAEARGLFRLAAQTYQPHFLRHNPRADLTSLEKLAVSCQRFSPTVGWQETEFPDTLLLDLTGCTHLFGSEQQLATQVVDQLQRQGYRVRVAIADTIGAAWALAHFKSDNPSKSKNPNPQSEILSFPVAALRLSERTVQTLQELDICRVEQLAALPRASLPARLGTHVIQRLDQAMGRVSELIIPVQPREEVELSETFEHPLVQRTALAIVMGRLAQQVLEKLAVCGEGVQRLEIRLAAAGQTLCCSVGFVRPCTDAEHLTQTIHTRLERLSLPGEIMEVSLRVTCSSSLETRQISLLAEHQDEACKQFDLLIERMSSRLGEQCVLRSRLYPDAQPEYAFRWQAAVGPPVKQQKPVDSASSQDSCPPRMVAARPLVLKPQPLPLTVLTGIADGPPIRFRCEAQEHAVCRSWGPERITTGWWRKESLHRDYYRVETDQGRQLWLFYCHRHRCWFLQGEFI